MKKYSVLLLWPDYATEMYEHDTFFAKVEAENPDHAIDRARVDAYLSELGNGVQECRGFDGRPYFNEPVDSLVDFTCLLVLEGYHRGEMFNPWR